MIDEANQKANQTSKEWADFIKNMKPGELFVSVVVVEKSPDGMNHIVCNQRIMPKTSLASMAGKARYLAQKTVRNLFGYSS